MKPRISIVSQWIVKAQRAAASFWADDRGGEVIEYVLIAGLIIVAAISMIAAVGTKVLARWTSVNSSM
jgi:Flp pilus assembly pilin Flp